MAITSIGYPEQIGKTNVDWALWQQSAGCEYWCNNLSGIKPTPKSGGTRQVHLSYGQFGGQGIHDSLSSGGTDVTLPTVESGTKNFMIVARRNWNPDDMGTTFTYIEMGSSTAVLPEREHDAQVAGGSGIDDQPIAIVSLTAGDTEPKIVADLRVFGGTSRGLYTAYDERVMQYLDEYGTQVVIGNVTWTRRGDGWRPSREIIRSGPGLGNPLSVSSAGGGWVTVGELNCKGTRDGNQRYLYLQARKAKGGDHVNFSSGTGHVNNTAVLSVDNADWKPPHDLSAVAFEYKATDSGVYGGVARYTANGNFIILSGAPGTTIAYSDSHLGSWTIKCTQLSWIDER